MSQHDDDRTILAARVGGADDDDRTVIVGGSGDAPPGTESLADDARALVADDGGATEATSAPAAAASTSSLGHNALSVGMKLGEFEITGLVGEGGFGIVYLAYDHSLERQVALKEYMPSELAQRERDSTVIVRSQRHAETFAAGMRSFINEAKLLAQFDHPSLVKVYRFWEANGTAYMVMPFYEGITLKTALKELGHPPDETWLKAQLAQLLDALEIIHNRQCYHRDIAPDNIMILPDETPLLLDFGAARRVIGDMTQALTVILKPGYAPIEQYAEVPNMRQGPWTDLYALASVVYFAIEGKAPVPAVARVMSDPLAPLAQSAAGRYSDEFLHAIDRALSVKPDDRPQNIAEFRRLLGFAERAPTTRYLPSGTERRSSEDRIASPTVPTAVAPAATAPGRSAAAPRPAAGRSPRETRSKVPLIIGGATALAVALGALVFFVVLDDPLPIADMHAPSPIPSGAAPGRATASVEDLQTKLTGFECARLDVALNGATAVVRGHVSSDGDLQRISAQLTGTGGVTSVDHSGVQVYPQPYCHVASALGPYAGQSSTGPNIALKSGGAAAFEGDKLVTVVTASDFPGFVYADLYDTEGNVVHMMPNAKERNNRVDARQRVVIGDDPLFGVQWDVLPPLGKHMLVVMNSHTPLFLPKNRPDLEKTGPYLLALREELDKMRQGDKFVVHYTLVDFLPKKR